mmetsp:Transcript_29040/g.92926  ORF Transcript_29040/g.92926 Transcript_29040/m.92926 type:complete len:257 (-) Transcript_29040:415-1185(-)
MSWADAVEDAFLAGVRVRARWRFLVRGGARRLPGTNAKAVHHLRDAELLREDRIDGVLVLGARGDAVGVGVGVSVGGLARAVVESGRHGLLLADGAKIDGVGVAAAAEGAPHLDPALLGAAEADEVGLDGVELRAEQRRRGPPHHADADALDAEVQARTGAAVALLEAVPDAHDALQRAVMALHGLAYLVRERRRLPAVRLVREHSLESGARADDAHAAEGLERAAQEDFGAELHPAGHGVGNDDDVSQGQHAARG